MFFVEIRFQLTNFIFLKKKQSLRKFLSLLLKKNWPRACWNVTSGQSVLSVNYNRLGNYGNNYHSPFVFIHRRGIVYHLFTAYNVYSNHWRSDEDKRNHSWLFAWFCVTRLGHRKSLLKVSACRSFSETVTYNSQMTLICLPPSSICNDFICTRGHQLLLLRAKQTFLLSSLQMWKSFRLVVVAVLFS